MHSAPAVTYPAGRAHGARWLLLAIWLVGAISAALAVAGHDGVAARDGAWLANVWLAGAVAWRWGGHREVGQVRFDGQYWSWSGRAMLGAARAHVGLDLQSLMLVRLTEPERPRQWLWLERRSDPLRWVDLRRAVYSRAPAASPVDAPADAAALGVPASTR
jgi:hypothetical protein